MSSSHRHEDVSIEHPTPSGDQGTNVDFLMDENILTNESREEEVFEGVHLESLRLIRL